MSLADEYNQRAAQRRSLQAEERQRKEAELQNEAEATVMWEQLFKEAATLLLAGRAPLVSVYRGCEARWDGAARANRIVPTRRARGNAAYAVHFMGRAIFTDGSSERAHKLDDDAGLCVGPQHDDRWREYRVLQDGTGDGPSSLRVLDGRLISVWRSDYITDVRAQMLEELAKVLGDKPVR